MEETGEVSCSTCGEKIVDDSPGKAFLSRDQEEHLHDLKSIVKLQEGGITLDYRCPDCRSCIKCKNPIDTDRISLRQEAECEAIKDSIKIDHEAKKITCTLPLRGKEEQFLSNNRDVAVKVLDSQCKKVFKDEEAKAAVIKSFYKLFDGKYARRFSDLSKEEQEMISSKPVQHYLPWRVVYKDSVSTPVRTVVDASSKTPIVSDGNGGTRGGRCLNDLTVKGRVNTLNLINMVLLFVTAQVAYAGDLKQFYTSIALDSSQWNLQRVLWREGLDPMATIEEIIIVSLIFGIRAVSALSEQAVLMLAERIRSKNFTLFQLLTMARFVDDLASSTKNHKIAKETMKAADELFESVGLKVKAWTISGSKPSAEVSSNGMSIDVAGMEWCPVLDTLSIKIPPIHFGKKMRGKITAGTEVFDGTFADLEAFVPAKVTRRHVVSKHASIFDPLGHLVPETAKLKLLTRIATKETKGWDDPVSPDTRSKFIQCIWRLFKLRSMKFARAKIPADAEDCKMYLMGKVDASDEMKIVGVWARFARKSGGYSAQLLIARSLLSRGGTIAQEELESLTIGSNLLWVCRRALEGWLEDYGLFGDSVISLCWTTSENKRLSIFHRNRVVQIRFHTELEKLYHVRTAFNAADLGTRPAQVKEDSVGPASDWENGLEWMRKLSIEEAINQDIVKPAKALRIEDKEEAEFDKGFIFERCPEILVKGHFAFVSKREEKLLARATFSKYLIFPMKYDFKKIVLITAGALKHLKLRVPEIKKILQCQTKFKVFSTTNLKSESGKIEVQSLSNLFAHGSYDDVPVKRMNLTDADINQALNYWYKKGTQECKQFNKSEMLSKISVEKDEILFSRSRILDGQRFVMTGGFDKDSLGLEVDLNLSTPLLDRYSPIAYSIAWFIHNQVAKHAGIETCYRLSLSFCHILQGASLFREIAEECTKCKMLRKKYLQAFMGPISPHQLTICPAFYTAYMDIDGPYTIYVPGFEKATRNRQALDAKNWILSFACPVTKLVCLQVIESKSAEGVMDGITRLGCEFGFPKFLLLDQEQSFMKAVREAEIDLMDLSCRSFKEYGIRCEVSPVAGHNYTGLIEAKIYRVQQCFEKIELKKKRIHSTGLQTVAKLVESHLNSLPLGYSYGRTADNTPILKIITPNMMKIGRLNDRTLTGPVRFPSGPKGLMKNVEEIFNAYYRLWNTSYVPKLIPQPKWFKMEEDLKTDDVVFFQKDEADFSSKWIIGQVDSVARSRDGLVRRANIRYFNHNEKNARFTDRAVRSLVRLFNIEDNYFIEDMSKVELLVKALEKKAEVEVPKVDVSQVKSAVVKVDRKCDCCCDSHHKLSFHTSKGMKVDVMSESYDDVEISNIFDSTFGNDFVADQDCIRNLSSDINVEDEIYRTLTALETDFNLATSY